MIYLFNACGPLKQCCVECKFSLGNWFHKPLGPYVVLGMALSGAEAAMCMLSLLDKGLEQCQGITPRAKEVGIEYWLVIQFGMASVNFIFCPYIQYRLWQNLQLEAAEIEEEDMKAGASQFTQPDAFVDVPQEKIKEAFWNVFWYDFGVCGYVFVLFGSGFWSFLGTRWFGGQPFCDATGYVENAVSLGDLFVIFVTLYFIGFNFYMSCASSLEVNPASKQLMTAASSGAYHLATQQVKGQVPLQQQPPVQGKGKGKAATSQFFGGKSKSSLFGGGKAKSSLFGGNKAAPPMAAPLVGVAGAPQAKPLPRTKMERAMHPAMMVKLVACLGLDLMGDATYFLPGLGETFDIAWAPAQAIAMKMMFRYYALPAFGFTEEILPGTDIIPSATLGWLVEVCAPDNGFTRAVGIRSDYSP